MAYVSRSNIGGDLGKLIALQNECVASNRERDVSGVLYYDGEYFFQVLEGNYQTVKDLYDRICRDDRHDECRTLINMTVLERRFASHPMKIINAIANPCMSSQIVPNILANPQPEFVQRKIRELVYA